MKPGMTDKTPFSNLDTEIQETVAVDLDGCLAHYDEWRGPDHIGPPIPSMVRVCQQLHSRGCLIVVNTCRLNKTNNREYGVDTEKSLATIRKWLNDHDLPFVAISLDDGKPFAHAYVDDRGVSFRDSLSSDLIFARILELLER